MSTSLTSLPFTDTTITTASTTTTALTPITSVAIEPVEKPVRRANYHARVHDMPVDERPRERLRNEGAENLSQSELLAIILRTGTVQDNVIELSTRLLAKYGGIKGLARISFAELCSEHGVGEAKAAQLLAALEIGKRLSRVTSEEKYQIRSADDAARLIKMDMMYLTHEEMRILVLDTKNNVVENIARYKGTVNSSVLRAAEVYRAAVIRNCPSVIIAHNHPSGDPTPSPEDIEVTRQLVEAGRLLDIELLDHLIIGNPRHVSLKERLHW